MVLRRIWALALTVHIAAAFRDTSPFFLFSTTRISDVPIAHSQLVSSSALTDQVSHALSSCPSDTYIIIAQPGVSASDFSAGSSSPNLRQYLNKTAGIVETWVVPEVAGLLDARSLERQVQERCKADVLRIDATTGAIPNDGVYPRVVYVRFPSLPTARHDRMSKLAEHDSFLHAVISEVGGDKYSVIYTTTPPSADFTPSEQQVAPDDYEMDDPFQSVLHTDLKRELGSTHAQRSDKDNLALFDKYQYLSPGVFMGLFVFILLFMILYVGISAVASLQVSYFAFSKEMGPSQQKKS
ncbi:uncharacterized protein PV09_07135 [Verruconis gallopava]|uniref:Protein BIG1 n=1 Tax=Verruconis gallopava TaxID=253628 RepID=A0A0D1XGN2_9PEZI|nr:uncharacterized protein PV09_07135 [Verruconis gallopava]KIW01366.1 hypothetical protein PV09_07135 [Verruconis gallopava]